MDTAAQTVADESQLSISSEELDSIEAPSRPFIGSWQSLVSQTNWEKGKIIFEWRQQLQTEQVSPRLFSDPTWSRLVGEVSPQHVGRLRRTWEKFQADYSSYEGLYWSHFFAALEWNDAEMWLEGAVQNKWSVSQMRHQRWETMGKVKDEEPLSNVVTDVAEEGLGAIAPASQSGETAYQDDPSAIQGPLREGPDFGEEPNATTTTTSAEELSGGWSDRVDLEAILADVTDDIEKPFRDLREAIISARDDDWKSVKRIDVIALVNELKMLLRKLPKPAAETETS